MGKLLLVLVDVPDNCVLCVQGLMGNINGEEEGTNEAWRPGKARLRTRWPYGETGPRGDTDGWSSPQIMNWHPATTSLYDLA